MTTDLIRDRLQPENDMTLLEVAVDTAIASGENEIKPYLETFANGLQKEVLVTDLAKWYLFTTSKLEGLRAEYKPLMDAMNGNIKELEQRLEYIKYCINSVLQPGPESVVANESIYAFYQTSKKVVIENEQQIPIDFSRVETVPDTALIKKALEAGEQVAGARLESRWNLQVRFGGERAIKNARKLKEKRQGGDDETEN